LLTVDIGWLVATILSSGLDSARPGWGSKWRRGTERGLRPLNIMNPKVW